MRSALQALTDRFSRSKPGPATEGRVQQLFAAPLRRIEFPGQGQTPIWAATGYDPENLVGISERFLGNADIYTATYTHSENILELLRRAAAEFDIPIEQMSSVLDFGSGPGTNTVFPLHLINPSLHIVATDISLNLLATLSHLLGQHPQRDQVDIVAWDCMSGGIQPNSFDFVTGASLLHHLMDPRLALNTAAEALKPGGYAFFVDPFDGAGLVRGLYQVLLHANLGHNERLSEETVSALEILSADYAARLPGTKPEDFTYLEDKWIFAPEWIAEQGKAAGFSEVIVRGNQSGPNMYGTYVRTQLRMAAGPRASELPDWANEILQAFDTSLTPPARRRMMLEATIVMRK